MRISSPVEHSAPARGAAPVDLQKDWQERLTVVLETLQEMSRQTDPQELVRTFGRRMANVFPGDRRISLSRRGLTQPWYRVTRYTGWTEEVNPWESPEKLPVLHGGLLADLIYAEEPVILDDFSVSPADPAFEYLEGQRSLMAVPHFDGGQSLNMVVTTSTRPRAFDRERFPETVWMSNLFGRATQNLLLNTRLKEAYAQIDRELKTIAEIQRGLLPRCTPEIATLGLSAYYRTSQHAGGDYYDFFELGDGKWGILIADVSGHGTPSAVVMAITHAIAHLSPKESDPAKLLTFVNKHLTTRYTSSFQSFVTAFYAVYDEASRTLTYSCAGHNPPRLTSPCASHVAVLCEAADLPLGLSADIEYQSHTRQLTPGDRLVIYTDGITEAANVQGELFGTRRLDMVLQSCGQETADALLERLLEWLLAFTEDAAPADDRTVIVATVR